MNVNKNISNDRAGFIISAPASHSGKTLISLALLRHFHQENIPLLSGKSGPDYIDTLFHAKASRAGVAMNLDSWAMRLDSLLALQNMAIGKLLLIEGAMGLYDGAAGTLQGSTAHLAQILGLPIIFILPVKRQSRSICALLQGFLHYRKHHSINGIILNGVGSKNHETYLRDSLGEDFPEIPILGALPWQANWHLESRHLGLKQPESTIGFGNRITEISNEMIRFIDHNALLRIANQVAVNVVEKKAMKPPLLTLHNIRHLAIAQDEAFRFSYATQLALWQQQNITLSFFSPLANQPPNPDADMIFLPGGYPELFAKTISEADIFISGLHQAHRQGKWIYGECGGYMVMGKTIEDESGNIFSMANLFSHHTTIKNKKRHIGYRMLYLPHDTPFRYHYFRGHEFHYSLQIDTDNLSGEEILFTKVQEASTKKIMPSGKINGRVFGSYIHLIDSDEANFQKA